MADENQNCWVVLISKKPRGPFSEDEVNELLDAKQIKNNDLAFETTADGKVALSGWKLIWQFEQFDRRSGAKPKKKEVKKALEAAGVEDERREKKTKKALSQETTEKVPEEIAEISPEELVIHMTKTATNGNKKDKGFDSPLPIQKPEMPQRMWYSSMPFLVSMVGLVFVLGLFYNWSRFGDMFGPLPTVIPQQQALSPTDDPTIRRPAQRVTPLSGARPSQAPSGRSPSERFRPEDIEKRRPAADTGIVAEPDDDDLEDDEYVRPAKKRKSQRARRSRRRQAEEIEDDEFGDEDEDEFLDEEDEYFEDDEFADDEEFYDE